MTWLAPNWGLPKTASLKVLAPELRIRSASPAPRGPATAVASWNTPSILDRARDLARKRALPLTILDNGLLASPHLPHRPMPMLSLTCVGIEQDGGRTPCWSADMLARTGWETSALMTRALAGIAEITAARIGGLIGLPLPRGDARPRRVLVDCTREADPAAAEALLRLALSHADAGEVRCALPPDPNYAGLRQQAQAWGCAVVTTDTDSWSLLDEADHIFTLGGPLGFLALLAGRKTYCGADTTYSGWGLTEDAATVTRHGRTRSLEELFAAICLEATRYADPFREIRCHFEETAAILRDWRSVLDRNTKIACCYGIDFWKRDRTRDFFLSPLGTPTIAASAEEAMAFAGARRKAIAYWPQRPSMAAFEATARARGVTVIRIEDGFIRSVGLGTNLVLPASIVSDSRGIFYDPTTPSDLETILSETQFDSALLARAKRLGELLVWRQITKYNLTESAVSLDAPDGARRILVPGQFEDDKSVLLGGAGIKTNEELLRRVRAANPDAFIVYKPHPDVESGHRKGIIASDVMMSLADAVVRRTSILSLIDWADEIHTLTSQTGFEALLRGRRVVTYGQPYYAGWGLTVDHNPVARRQRLLTLPELIAGALILYPRYIDPVTRLPCGPEIVIDRIADPKTRDRSRLSKARQIQGAIFAHAKELTGRLVPGRRG